MHNPFINLSRQDGEIITLNVHYITSVEPHDRGRSCMLVMSTKQTHFVRHSREDVERLLSTWHRTHESVRQPD